MKIMKTMTAMKIHMTDSSDSDDDDEMEDSFVLADSPVAVGRQSRRTFIDDDSDSEGGLEEYMSTNNEPSGPFVRDYDSHFFRVPDSKSASAAACARTSR